VLIPRGCRKCRRRSRAPYLANLALSYRCSSCASATFPRVVMNGFQPPPLTIDRCVQYDRGLSLLIEVSASLQPIAIHSWASSTEAFCGLPVSTVACVPAPLPGNYTAGPTVAVHAAWHTENVCTSLRPPSVLVCSDILEHSKGTALERQYHLRASVQIDELNPTRARESD
jgi:hypothetical protein